MNNNTMNTPVAIPVSKLHPFEGHPYKVLDNEEMNTLIESIQTQGILSPLIVRPMENTTDEYEVVSGHRRLHAAVKAGLETVPAFIYARYQRMMQKYEKEQRELAAEVENAKNELQSAEQKTVDLRLLLKTIREITEVKELTSGLVHSLIERIEVHNNDKYDGHCHVKVDIYFSVIGMMDIPDEKEIQAMMDEVQKNPQKYRYVA